jgi:hypothetical protein
MADDAEFEDAQPLKKRKLEAGTGVGSAYAAADQDGRGHSSSAASSAGRTASSSAASSSAANDAGSDTDDDTGFVGSSKILNTPPGKARGYSVATGRVSNRDIDYGAESLAKTRLRRWLRALLPSALLRVASALHCSSF